MLAIVGTVPDETFPLTEGQVRLEKDTLVLQGRRIPVNRGTPALLAQRSRRGISWAILLPSPISSVTSAQAGGADNSMTI